MDAEQEGTPTIGLLSDADWKAALERIEHEAALLPPRSSQGTPRARQEARHQRTVRCLMRIQPDNEPATIFLVATRNLSRGGMAVLHGTPLDKHTPVIMAIEMSGGFGSIQPANVAWCRRVGIVGSEGSVAYEIGLRFDRPIHLEPWLEADAA
jgi:hypothetical protein